MKWYIDGENYFKDVCNAINQAKETLFITDWWLNPDLFLLRPAEKNKESQVVEAIGAAADRGVLVFIHLFKEISYLISLNSLYTKRRLIERNESIRVMRHPNVSIMGGTFLWSHHEKMVIVDSNLAFMGGLDLCYGR